MSIFSHHLPRSCKASYSPKKGRGFTLIEMLVTMSIMLIITVTLLVNQSRFDSSTVLRSLAYSVALSVRQAQVYGTSVIGTSTAQASCIGGFYNAGSCYASAYGLHLDSSVNGSYTLFADLNGNGKFTSSPVSESVKIFNLGAKYIISSFCAIGTNGGSSVTRCSPSTISTLDINFKRPNPDATFSAFDSSGIPIAGDVYSGAYIQIQAIGDPTNTKSISVLSTGEVSVCTTAGC